MTFDVVAAARRRMRRLMLVAAGGALAVCALVYPAGLYVNARMADRAQPAPATTDPTPPGPSPSLLPSPVAVVLPADTAWSTVAGVAVPYSATAGPLLHERGLASGFARSPAGALLAAVHLLVNTTPQVGAAIFVPTLRQQVVGPHAAAMQAAVASDYERIGGDPTVGGPVGLLPAALAGARLAAFTDRAANTDPAARIDLLTVAIDATGTARFAATLIDLVWTGADWALLAPPGGRWDGLVTAVAPSAAATYPPLGPGR